MTLMKGTGIVRVAPCQFECAWCKHTIMPLTDFIYWHRLVHLSTGYCCHILPVHKKCWKEINGEKGKTWKRTFYEVLLGVVSAVRRKIHCIE